MLKPFVNETPPLYQHQLPARRLRKLGAQGPASGRRRGEDRPLYYVSSRAVDYRLKIHSKKPPWLRPDSGSSASYPPATLLCGSTALPQIEMAG
jgi:hypothetical protein